jgi:hypothetical protein
MISVKSPLCEKAVHPIEFPADRTRVQEVMMPVSLPVFLGDLSPFTIEEKRRMGEDYVEIVAKQSEWPAWSERLTSLLGAALKPAGEKATPEQERISGPWGGIQKNQILFSRRVESDDVLVLIWPWRDEERFTLKAVRITHV